MMTDDSGKGTYILWLYAVTPAVVEIGKLGTFRIDAGWYAYVGSAMGSGGLQGRLRHHLSPLRRPHWHVDYLRQAAICQQVWAIIDDQPFEHRWASLLHQMPGAVIPIQRFGSSDCHCEAHLFRFTEQPAFDAFQIVAHGNVFIWNADQ
jgi:Uri superfamily endonuclease